MLGDPELSEVCMILHAFWGTQSALGDTWVGQVIF